MTRKRPRGRGGPRIAQINLEPKTQSAARGGRKSENKKTGPKSKPEWGTRQKKVIRDQENRPKRPQTKRPKRDNQKQKGRNNDLPGQGKIVSRRVGA